MSSHNNSSSDSNSDDNGSLNRHLRELEGLIQRRTQQDEVARRRRAVVEYIYPGLYPESYLDFHLINGAHPNRSSPAFKISTRVD